MVVKDDQLTNKASDKAPYTVLSIGRFSPEKDQITLLRAMRYSRHSDEIQLNFAGFGNLLDKFENEGNRMIEEGVLKYRPQFGFYKFEHLRELISESYLYFHGALVEVEGLSCLEALRGGVVPVIADAPLAATKDFALTPQSLFKARDARALAQKIDWWIEHPEEREDAGQRYADFSRKFAIGKSIDSLIEMYRSVLDR